MADTSILFAGIQPDGTTRGLLIDSPLELLAPEQTLAEIRRNTDAIVSRSNLSVGDVELLLALLTEETSRVLHASAGPLSGSGQDTTRTSGGRSSRPHPGRSAAVSGLRENEGLDGQAGLTPLNEYMLTA